jgi:sugar transferase (PEP-CTERM system associated)
VIKVFSHWFASNVIFQVAVDLMFLFLAVLLAITWVGHRSAIDFAKALPYAMLFAVAMVLLNAWLGLYRRRQGEQPGKAWVSVVLSLFLAIPVAYGVFETIPHGDVHLGALQLSASMAMLSLVAVKAYATYARLGPMLVRRVLVLGTGAEASDVAKFLKWTLPHVELVGFYSTKVDSDLCVPTNQVLRSDVSLVDLVRTLNVDEVVVAVSERRGGVMPLRDLLDCKLAGVAVVDLASFFERVLGQVRLDSLKASWLIFGEGFRQGVVRTVVKRVFDIVAATFLLLLFCPIMVATAILIAMESGFPVLYRQERVGLHGRLFQVIKFRSMRTDAERDGKPRWAKSNDDRVTRVGRAIRRVRIDELPQLFNVLMGDMSMAGPRPERPYFVDQLTREIPFYAARHSVKPGVTGWAQVRYHYGASVSDAAEKLQYDLYYVKNHSLFLDVVVLFDTVGVVLSGAGAQ